MLVLKFIFFFRNSSSYLFFKLNVIDFGTWLIEKRYLLWKRSNGGIWI